MFAVIVLYDESFSIYEMFFFKHLCTVYLSSSVKPENIFLCENFKTIRLEASTDRKGKLRCRGENDFLIGTH